MCMVTVFFVVVVIMGLDFKLLTLGLLPNISGKKSDAFAEPADIILSLVETTFLGFRILLRESLAKRKSFGVIPKRHRILNHL